MSAHSNEQAATYFNIMWTIIESNYLVKCKNIKYLLNQSGYCTYLIQKQHFFFWKIKPHYLIACTNLCILHHIYMKNTWGIGHLPFNFCQLNGKWAGIYVV